MASRTPVKDDSLGNLLAASTPFPKQQGSFHHMANENSMQELPRTVVRHSSPNESIVLKPPSPNFTSTVDLNEDADKSYLIMSAEQSVDDRASRLEQKFQDREAFYEKQLADSEMKVKNLLETIRQLETKNRTLRKRVDESDAFEQKTQHQLKLIAEENDALKNELSVIKSLLEEYETELEELRAVKADSDTVLSSKNARIQTLHSTLEAMEGELKASEAAREACEQRIRELDAELEEFQKVQNKSFELETDNTRLRNEVEQLHHQLHEQDDFIPRERSRSLQEEITAVKTTSDEWKPAAFVLMEYLKALSESLEIHIHDSVTPAELEPLAKRLYLGSKHTIEMLKEQVKDLSSLQEKRELVELFEQLKEELLTSVYRSELPSALESFIHFLNELFASPKQFDAEKFRDFVLSLKPNQDDKPNLNVFSNYLQQNVKVIEWKRKFEDAKEMADRFHGEVCVLQTELAKYDPKYKEDASVLLRQLSSSTIAKRKKAVPVKSPAGKARRVLFSPTIRNITEYRPGMAFVIGLSFLMLLIGVVIGAYGVSWLIRMGVLKVPGSYDYYVNEFYDLV